LWNYEQHGVVPDLMASAKPLGGGLPLGAVIACEKVAMAISPGNHGTTFGGNPIACALGCEVLKIISTKPFLNNVVKNGRVSPGKTRSLAKKYSSIKEVRGCGLLIGIEMKVEPKDVVAQCKSNGLLVIAAGSNTVRFMPPLIVTKTQCDAALAIFEKCL